MSILFLECYPFFHLADKLSWSSSYGTTDQVGPWPPQFSSFSFPYSSMQSFNFLFLEECWRPPSPHPTIVLLVFQQLSFEYLIYIPPQFLTFTCYKNTQCCSSRIQVNHLYYSFFSISPQKIKYFFPYNKRKTLPRKWLYIVGGSYHTHAKWGFLILTTT